MEKEKIKEILLNRAKKLTDPERAWVKKNLGGWYHRYLMEYGDAEQDYTDTTWEAIWLYSAFGQYYLRNMSLAKKFLSSEEKMNYVMEAMDDRKGWYTTGVKNIKAIRNDGLLSANIMCVVISTMRTNNFNIFSSYTHEPIYSKGAIVQFRSNIGVDAVIKEHTYGGRKSYYGAEKSTLRRLKGKTMMVLGEAPKLGGRCFAGIYSHKEKVGGSRYYRVLAVGDTKVYLVVEKFLKKCRTKAVKDAKK